MHLFLFWCTFVRVCVVRRRARKPLSFGYSPLRAPLSRHFLSSFSARLNGSVYVGGRELDDGIFFNLRAGVRGVLF